MTILISLLKNRVQFKAHAKTEDEEKTEMKLLEQALDKRNIPYDNKIGDTVSDVDIYVDVNKFSSSNDIRQLFMEDFIQNSQPTLFGKEPHLISYKFESQRPDLNTKTPRIDAATLIDETIKEFSTGKKIK